MPFRIVLCLVLAVAVPVVSFAQDPGVVAVNRTYEARIRLNGKVSTTRVQASDAGLQKKRSSSYLYQTLSKGLS